MADPKLDEKPAEKSVEETGGPVWTPPSQQEPPQYPAIKPGEPIPANTPDPLRTDTIKPEAKEPKQSNVAGSSPAAPKPAPPPPLRRP
jgi:hypothetical protein